MSDVRDSEAVRQAAMQRLSVPTQSPQKDRELQAVRKKVVQLVNSQLLDYKHCSLQSLAACVTVLLRLCKNVLENPSEQKFRQVKISNAKLQAQLAVKPAAAQSLLLEAGWKIEVVHHEKHYVYLDDHTSSKFRHLQVAVQELQSADRLLQSKMQRGGDGKAARDKEEAERREAALLQFQDDRDRRRLLDEQHQAVLAEVSSPQQPDDEHADNDQYSELEHAEGKKDR